MLNFDILFLVNFQEGKCNRSWDLTHTVIVMYYIMYCDYIYLCKGLLSVLLESSRCQVITWYMTSYYYVVMISLVYHL
jgi:hypothetical protein